ncbi:integrase [Vibrio parahaemolyticus]|uniref:tyrosine-type recombinase/integrase n=1 Tax=Vibrio parahaemolyticus TaxID=670 RepID=UPI001123BB0B|nr:tyrosine-type recombinase/integrase [Vibrio parahaemolyticus]TOG13874.1 integrase [Vibrio parahaemolyticus]
MYLLRLPNSVYYTRVATPLSLRSMGYPKEIRFSLFTRERRVAYLRNVEHTKLIFALFNDADSQQLPYNTFKAQLNEQVNQLRQQFQQENTVDIALCKSLPINKETTPNNTAPQVDEQTLDRFIASKQLEKITNLTLKQLRQRCGDFLAFLKKQEAAKISSSVAMAYRDELLCRGLSHKTLKDYLAANKQFLNWCVVHELLQSNPFTQVKLPSKSGSDSSQRTRWGISELKRLFNSQAFKQQDESFRWATMIMFRHGCRPSESCQLRVKDIKFDQSIPIIHFNEAGDRQHLKNSSSNRQVPIHHCLLADGFLNYVRERKQLGCIQLFDFTPRGADFDWSKSYRDTMGDVLTACGFRAGNRPTAYSFRHTFIDELKRSGVPEHIVSQIVGHRHNSMTFGHYGSVLEPEHLRDAVNSFTLSLE